MKCMTYFSTTACLVQVHTSTKSEYNSYKWLHRSTFDTANEIIEPNSHVLPFSTKKACPSFWHIGIQIRNNFFSCTYIFNGLDLTVYTYVFLLQYSFIHDSSQTLHIRKTFFFYKPSGLET